NDHTLSSPTVSNLTEGIYKCRLTVSDGTYSANDEVLILVSASGNSSPSVSVSSPVNGASYVQGAAIAITAAASDLDGTITLVEFYSGTLTIGEDDTAPYQLEWMSPDVGTHQITAVATDNGGGQSTSSVVNV